MKPEDGFRTGKLNYDNLSDTYTAYTEESDETAFLLKNGAHYVFVIFRGKCSYGENISCLLNYDIDFERRALSRMDESNTISPSYNCSNKLTKIEKLICNSTILSIFDLILSKEYKRISNKSKKIDQRLWLKKINLCKSNKNVDKCLFDNYHSRINSLIKSQ